MAREVAGRPEQLGWCVAEGVCPGKAGSRIGSKREHLLCSVGLGRIDAAVILSGVEKRTAKGGDEVQQPMEYGPPGGDSAFCWATVRGISVVEAAQRVWSRILKT